MYIWLAGDDASVVIDLNCFQTPGLGLGLGVDFTFANNNNNKTPQLNFLRRNGTMDMKFGTQT